LVCRNPSKSSAATSFCSYAAAILGGQRQHVAFDERLQVLAHFGVRDVDVLERDRAAVDGAQPRDELAERDRFGGEAVHGDLAFEVGLAQAERGQL
jgi:hypothetical protein